MPLYPVDGAWTQVELLLVATTTGVEMSVKLDGKQSVAPLTTHCSALGGIQLQLGTQYAQGGEVYFDDVVLEGE